MSSEPRKPSAHLGGEPVRVLVVDDDEVNLRIARQHLESLGCSVRVVDCGEAALRVVDEVAFDVILMDCHMPGMDGFSTTAAIRGRPTPPVQGTPSRVPIVGFTADGTRERCLAAGMDDHLRKPVDAVTLRAVVKRWVERLPDSRVDRWGHPSDAGEPTEPVDELARFRSFRSLMSHEEMKELARLFHTDFDSMIGRMRKAVADADGRALRMAAHGLKGSSGNLGSERVPPLCTRIEGYAESGRMDEACRLITEIEEECSRFLGLVTATLSEKED